MKDKSVEYGRTQEAASSLADDLKLVKTIKAITLYPQEANRIPLAFVITLITAAKNILVAKGNSSKVKKGRAMLVDQSSYQAEQEIEARELVDAAIMAHKKPRFFRVCQEYRCKNVVSD
jgi:hypothetical protein